MIKKLKFCKFLVNDLPEFIEIDDNEPTTFLPNTEQEQNSPIKNANKNISETNNIVVPVTASASDVASSNSLIEGAIAKSMLS